MMFKQIYIALTKIDRCTMSHKKILKATNVFKLSILYFDTTLWQLVNHANENIGRRTYHSLIQVLCHRSYICNKTVRTHIKSKWPVEAMMASCRIPCLPCKQELLSTVGFVVLQNRKWWTDIIQTVLATCYNDKGSVLHNNNKWRPGK